MNIKKIRLIKGIATVKIPGWIIFVSVRLQRHPANAFGRFSEFSKKGLIKAFLTLKNTLVSLVYI